MKVDLKSYNYERNHIHDGYTNRGYDFSANGILNRVLSSELFSNPHQDVPLRQIERLIEYLVKAAGRIKVFYSIAHDKDETL